MTVFWPFMLLVVGIQLVTVSTLLAWEGERASRTWCTALLGTAALYAFVVLVLP